MKTEIVSREWSIVSLESAKKAAGTFLEGPLPTPVSLLPTNSGRC